MFLPTPCWSAHGDDCQTGVMSEPAVELNRTKIRVGLAILSSIFLGALAMLFIVEDPLGKTVFVVVALMLLVRMSLLVRGVRRDARRT